MMSEPTVKDGDHPREVLILALIGALKADDMPAAAALIKMLAAVDPNADLLLSLTDMDYHPTRRYVGNCTVCVSPLYAECGTCHNRIKNGEDL